MRRRRKRSILVGALLVGFVAVLYVWVGNPNRNHLESEGPIPTDTPTPTSSFDQSAVAPTPSITPTVPTGSKSGAGGTGGAGGAGTVKLPPVSGVQVYGAGVHTVVLRVTSNSTLSAVGWAFRNGKNGKKQAAGKTFTLTEEVQGGAPLAILGAQVAYYGTEATCTITVDGTLRTTKTVHGAYSVVVCTA
jgi:hypothetical protein